MSPAADGSGWYPRVVATLKRHSASFVPMEPGDVVCFDNVRGGEHDALARSVETTIEEISRYLAVAVDPEQSREARQVAGERLARAHRAVMGAETPTELADAVLEDLDFMKERILAHVKRTGCPVDRAIAEDLVFATHMLAANNSGWLTKLSTTRGRALLGEVLTLETWPRGKRKPRSVYEAKAELLRMLGLGWLQKDALKHSKRGRRLPK